VRPARRRAASPAAPSTAAPARLSTVLEGLRGLALAFTSHDAEGVRAFWTGALGLAPGPRDQVGIGPAATLGFGPPEDGPPERWRPPREPLLCLVVDDADAAHATLAARGVAFEHPPQDAADGSRLALLRDPEGRLVALVGPPRRP
jgi:hypothetical protein